MPLTSPEYLKHGFKVASPFKSHPHVQIFFSNAQLLQTLASQTRRGEDQGCSVSVRALSGERFMFGTSQRVTQNWKKKRS
jgi:hypothetical protein